MVELKFKISFFAAAYCFKEKNQVQLIDAVVGKQHVSKIDEPGLTNHDIWKIVSHRDYELSSNVFDSDLSLVILTDAVKFTGQVQPICLPEPSQRVSMGTVVSWESKNHDLSMTLTPEEHSTTIISNMECISLSPNLKDAVTNQTLCARFKNESKSSCNLDLGDSLYVKSLKKFHIRGVFGYMLNGTNTNCRTKTRVVYIDIRKFSSWIYEEMLKDVRVEEKTFKCIKDAPKPFTQTVQCSEFKSFPNANNLKFKITSYELFDDAGKNFKNLKSLEVTKTVLKYLKRVELAKLAKLETFKFTMNKIEYLRKDVFWDLKNLKELSLEGNGLKAVSENHFIKLENLVVIDLSTNKLEYLLEDLFATNLKLESILLSDNPLKTIFIDFTRLPLLSNLVLKSAGCIDNEAESRAEVSVLVKNICKNNTLEN